MSKKILLYSLLLILLSSISFALIDISTTQNTYNLGNKIKVQASILKEENFDGILSLTLNCKNKNTQFFLTPISLQSNFRTSVQIPGFSADDSMLGNCSIRGVLLKNDEAIEGYYSNSFTISNKLIIEPFTQEIETTPGDIITIDGEILYASGNTPSDVKMTSQFNEKYSSTKTLNGDFTSIIKIPKIIKSGEHTITLEAFDSNFNRGSAPITINIIPQPTRIELELTKQSLNPKESVSFHPILLDQNNDPLLTPIELELKNPTGIKIFKKTVDPNTDIEHIIGQFDTPGTYTLEASLELLDTTESFAVLTKREVKITYQGDSVNVENIGNILYDDDLDFKLDGDKDYTITEKITLEPGEATTIDLTKEIEQGEYDILLEDDNNQTVTIEKEIVEEEKSNVVASQVKLDDNRPAPVKVISGFSKLTGAVIGSDGLIADHPFMAPALLVLIILGIVTYYNRGKVKNLLNKEKEEKIYK